MRKALLAGLIGLAVISGGIILWNSAPVEFWRLERQKANLPAAEPFDTTNATNSGESTNGANPTNINEPPEPVINTNEAPVVTNTNTAPPVTEIATEKNLAVPFTSQAPHANWDLDHNEFCEEASVLMVGRYFQGRGISGPDDAEEALQKIKQWEIDNLGFYYDTTAAETAKILEGLYELKVQLVKNPIVENINQAIANGKLVIVPAAGRELGNPNFTAPGPIYHNLVIRGYTKDGKFITNDPGTRKGQEYVYRQATVMNAMHDWVPKDPRTTARNGSSTGTPVILVVSK